MIHINRKSDFAFYLDLYDSAGSGLGVPDFDIDIQLSDDGYNVFGASVSKEGMSNATVEDGRILVVASRHGLSGGRLHLLLSFDLHDGPYPDGRHHIEVPVQTEAVLWDDVSDFVSPFSVAVTLPVPPCARDSSDSGECGLDIATDSEVRGLVKKIFNP